MADAIGIDVGSTNVKAVLVGDDGAVRARASRALVTDHDGDTATQDAGAMWRAVAETVRALVAADVASGADVAVIGVTSQYSSLVPVDAAGEPVGPVIMYFDQHGTDHSFAIFDRHDDAMEVWLERHGLPPFGGGLSLAHFLHLQHDRPAVHTSASFHLEPMDYVTMRLTGIPTATKASMFMVQLCDNRDLTGTDYDDDLLAMSGADHTRLAPLVDPALPVGPLRASVAAELGLGAEVVVYPGLNDTQIGAVATGALDPGRSGLSVGTTSVLIDTMPTMKVDLDASLSTMPGPLGDDYVLWAENGLGGRAIEFVLAGLIHADDLLGAHGVDDAFAAFDAVVAATPAGAGGALFLPWLSGSMAPRLDGGMRGGFLNLSLTTTRTELVRAAVEGVAHNIAWVVDVAADFMEAPVDRLVFSGGMARSRAAAQVLADVSGRPVAALEEPDQAVARAAALLALHRHDREERSRLSELVLIDHECLPDADAAPTHERMHEQFIAAFNATQPINQALSP